MKIIKQINKPKQLMQTCGGCESVIVADPGELSSKVTKQYSPFDGRTRDVVRMVMDCPVCGKKDLKFNKKFEKYVGNM
jgi:carbon monoxide dehydrogenase subunit G